MKYRACKTVDCDGKRYLTGDPIEVSGDQAAELLECGAIEPLNKPFSAKSVSVSVALKQDNSNV